MNAPRVALGVLPTPLVRAAGLERALGTGPLFLKRDDLAGFGIAGNKTRALEFLLGAAVAEGADVVVTAGSASSNFCAAAAMASRVVGLECDLLFPGAPPSAPSPNIALARECGARLVFGAVEAREHLDQAVVRHAAALRARGRRPYAVPRGGSTAVGALGYVNAAQELAGQCDAAGVRPRTVVVATGSGGTQAGLVAGRAGFGLGWRLIGAGVSRPVPGLADHILRVARGCAQAMGLDEAHAADVDVRDCRGPGFGLASAADLTSSRLALACEGLLLDDHYGAKAMTLFRDVATEPSATPAVFWHTGGVAGALSALVGRAA